jgi:hypothetical protein
MLEKGKRFLHDIIFNNKYESNALNIFSSSAFLPIFCGKSTENKTLTFLWLVELGLDQFDGSFAIGDSTIQLGVLYNFENLTKGRSWQIPHSL